MAELDGLRNGTANMHQLAAKTANPDVVTVLENALADAKKGIVAGVALTMVSYESKLACISAGDNAVALVCGLEQVKSALLGNIFAAQRPGGLHLPHRR